MKAALDNIKKKEKSQLAMKFIKEDLENLKKSQNSQAFIEKEKKYPQPKPSPMKTENIFKKQEKKEEKKRETKMKTKFTIKDYFT